MFECSRMFFESKDITCTRSLIKKKERIKEISSSGMYWEFLNLYWMLAVRSCQSLWVPSGWVACENGYIEGSRCNVSCNRGYQIQGQATLMCQDTKTWAPAPPACEGKVILSFWTYFSYESVFFRTDSKVHVELVPLSSFLICLEWP